MKTPSTDQPTPPVAEFLVAEARRMRRETGVTWGLGILMGSILIGYFTFIYHMVGTFLNPENAAFLVADGVRENAGQYIRNAEERLTQRALPLVAQSADTVLRTIPTLTMDAKGQFDDAVDVTLPALADEVERIGVAHARAAGDTLAPPPSAEDFVLLASGFGAGQVGEEVPLFTQTAVSLATLNRRIDALLAKDPGDLTEDEVATLRAIIGVIRQLTATTGEGLPFAPSE